MRNYAMSLSELADRRGGQGRDCQSQEDDELQQLLQALRELVDRLSLSGTAGAAVAGPPPCEPFDAEEVERWEGEEYLYLEAPLPHTLDAEIDVNIQGGRAFIRMPRG
jgi:hypothetical protein